MGAVPSSPASGKPAESGANPVSHGPCRSPPAGHTPPVPDVSWLFLGVSLAGAAFTWNAWFPRPAGTPLSIPSFFAGWLTSELVGHHFAWQLLATAGFGLAGAFERWPGRLGLGVTVASWAALLGLAVVARRSEPALRSALEEALGPDHPERIRRHLPAGLAEDRPPEIPWNPFRFHHPEVEVLRDLRYAPGAGRRHLLDLYRPRGGPEGAPVLLQVHGGGWVIGDKRQQALPLMTHLASRGFVCVAANYRLSPAATFPDHLIDLKLALRFIRERIAEFGGDPRFVAVTGGSAGGHLAALVALTAGDRSLQPGFEEVDTRVQACVPLYGVYDLANRFGHRHHDAFERFLGRVVLKRRFAEAPEAFHAASPVSRVHPDAPPFFVIHGTHDSLAPVEEARSFVTALREVSKAPVAYAELPGAQHAFEVFHSLRCRWTVHAVDRFLAAVLADWLAAGRGAEGGRGTPQDGPPPAGSPAPAS